MAELETKKKTYVAEVEELRTIDYLDKLGKSSLTELIVDAYQRRVNHVGSDLDAVNINIELKADTFYAKNVGRISSGVEAKISVTTYPASTYPLVARGVGIGPVNAINAALESGLVIIYPDPDPLDLYGILSNSTPKDIEKTNKDKQELIKSMNLGQDGMVFT